jgi:uncharacterized protein with PQ loop repeat
MNLSWIALTLAILATFPQMYLTISTGILRDYHPWTPILSLMGNFFLALHGYYRKDTPLMLFGVWFMLYNSILIYYTNDAS